MSGDVITEERKKTMFRLMIFIVGVSTSIVAFFGLIAQIKYEMIVEAWMPFDPLKNRINLILATEILALTMVVPCLYRSFAIQGLVCSLMMYVCDQLIELQENLRSLKYSPETETEMREKFKQIVKKHVRLIEYSKEMDKIFQQFFIVQNLAVTVEMCLNAMMVTLVGLREKYLLVNFLACLGMALLNAYIYCYLGNELIIQSVGISVSAYETAWTSWPIDMQKNLLLVIRQAQKPISLSAGGIATMSIETYCQALYNGYSIFAVLYDAVN
ncbi:7tm odorant receptor domain-containing protein [Phthorimaea operculella]|nr:7tm odorant receptor domain-containing protein [Phthorimaea operculella]